MKSSRSIILLFCMFLGVTPTTNKPDPNKVAAFATIVVAGALFKMFAESNTVKSALNDVYINPGEAQFLTGTLGTLFFLSFLDVKAAGYIAKWEMVSALIAKGLFSQYGQRLLHNIPFVGDLFVSETELNGWRTEREKLMRFKSTLTSMILLTILQQCLVATQKDRLRAYGMLPG